MSTEKKKGSGASGAKASVVETILQEIHTLYEQAADESKAPGLRRLSQDPLLSRTSAPLKIVTPRKRVSVLIVGNHSAGKSSFINWYIGEDVQKTGVAIETRGFSFVTHGKRRETLKGEATLRYFETLKEIEKFKGILPNLFTEISTSRAKSFPAVDLIDSPGLVDGLMQYPYDVTQSILWLADRADLILIFFDPVGQALCKRTMEVVEELNKGPHLEKIHYFLSKADTVAEEKDRYRVLIQVTQNLATKIRNSHAFKLPTFYLPSDKPCSVPNDIEDVCMEIDRTINSTVQKSLKALGDDAKSVAARIGETLEDDRRNRSLNQRAGMWGVLLNLLAVFTSGLMLVGLLGEAWTHVPALRGSLAAVDGVLGQVLGHGLDGLHGQLGDSRLGGTLGATLAVWLIANKVVWRVRPALSKEDRKRLERWQEYITGTVLPREEALYKQFFEAVGSDDR